jgi:phosphoglycolate phosphatase
VNLLFDLDGTLTDPFPGITGSIIYALEKMGRKSPAAEDLRWCIGPPLKNSFSTLLNSNDEQLTDTAVSHYRERFASKGLFENEVYPGIRRVLAELSQSGDTLFVATSKPHVFARKIIKHFELGTYFQHVYGSELDGLRSDKTDLIAHILEQEQIPAENTWMIGDREHDMIGAKANGLQSCGVLWGYGSKLELQQSGADLCLSSCAQLITLNQ